MVILLSHGMFMLEVYVKFGQPHQLALKKITSVFEAPEIRRGDSAGFQKFSLQSQSLVGLPRPYAPKVGLNSSVVLMWPASCPSS